MSEDKLIKERLGKIKELVNWGVDPYPYSYDRIHFSSQIKEKYAGLKNEEKGGKTKVAGRVMALREMGKAAFGDIQDENGRIQFYIRKDDVGDKYKVFKKIDTGDWIGLSGTVFRTKTGELSIWIDDFSLLCKSLRPLPDKYHGLKDVEQRYRNRALDLVMNPDVRDVFIKRSKVITAIREYLDKLGYIEVEIPVLQPVYGGANARPFKTHINAWSMDLYLSISPELYLKRLIIGGMGKVYTISKNFRNEGADKSHNPEFTMLEFYTPYTDYNDAMILTENLFEYVAKTVFGTTKFIYKNQKLDFKAPWKRVKMTDAVNENLKIDFESMQDGDIKELLNRNNINYGGKFSRGIALQTLFEELVEGKMIQPTFVIDHPKESTPLCKALRGNISKIERFEPYACGMELGNAYSELNDPILQKKLFKQQDEARLSGDEEAHPMDLDFCDILEYGMPPTSGVGIGIDRMVVFFTGVESIRDVILFPTMKPEQNDGKDNKDENKSDDESSE